MALGTKLKFGKERVHREVLSKSGRLMSVVLGRQHSGKDHMRELSTQKRCARKAAWDLAKNINKLKNSDKTTLYSPIEAWVMPALTSTRPEEREFAVDSGASMHTMSKNN